MGGLSSTDVTEQVVYLFYKVGGGKVIFFIYSLEIYNYSLHIHYIENNKCKII